MSSGPFLDPKSPQHLVRAALDDVLRRPLAGYIEAFVAGLDDKSAWLDWLDNRAYKDGRKRPNKDSLTKVDVSLAALSDYELWPQYFSKDLAAPMLGVTPSGRPSKTQEKEGRGRVLDLLAIRHRISHVNDEEAPLSDAEALGALEAIIRLLSAIGSSESVQRVKELKGVAAAREARRSHPKYSRSGLRLDEVSKDTLCIGAHWMDPQDTTGTPGGWWIAAIKGGTLLRIDRDLDTAAVVAYLTGAALEAPTTRVGLAFCFSAPAWYVREHHAGSPEEFWDWCSSQVDESADAQLICDVLGGPFRTAEKWSDADFGKSQPAKRATEDKTQERTGARPESIFKVGGRASVGALAVFGVRVLPALRSASYAIWPMDSETAPRAAAVEIFPRSLWAALNPDKDPVSSAEDRHRFLKTKEIAAMVDDGASKEKLLGERRAFDAFYTAFALSRYGRRLPARQGDQIAGIEGEIWLPDPAR